MRPQNNAESAKINIKTGKTFLFSILFGTVSLFAVYILFAFIVMKIDLSDMMMNLLVYIGIAIAGLISGFIAAKVVGSRGMVTGAINGTLFGILFILIGLISCQGRIEAMFWLKPIILLFFSVCGGIFGVNSKKHHR